MKQIITKTILHDDNDNEDDDDDDQDGGAADLRIKKAYEGFRGKTRHIHICHFERTNKTSHKCNNCPMVIAFFTSL